jgi:hypothetical protein
VPKHLLDRALAHSCSDMADKKERIKALAKREEWAAIESEFGRKAREKAQEWLAKKLGKAIAPTPDEPAPRAESVLPSGSTPKKDKKKKQDRAQTPPTEKKKPPKPRLKSSFMLFCDERRPELRAAKPGEFQCIV